MLNDRDYMRSGGQRPSRSNYAFRFDESVIQPIIIANVIVFFVQIMFRDLLESCLLLMRLVHSRYGVW